MASSIGEKSRVLALLLHLLASFPVTSGFVRPALILRPRLGSDDVADPTKGKTPFEYPLQDRWVYHGRLVQNPLQLSSESSTDLPGAPVTSPSKPRWRVIRSIQLVAVSLGLLFAFVSGYRLGSGGSNGELAKVTGQVVGQKVRRFPVLATVGVLLLIRDGWRALPAWFRRSLSRIVTSGNRSALIKVAKNEAVEVGGGATGTKNKEVLDATDPKKRAIDAVIEEEEVVDESPTLLSRLQGKLSDLQGDWKISDPIKHDDLTDMRVLGAKLQALFDTAQVKLSEQLVIDNVPDAKDDRAERPPPAQFKTFGPLLALVQLLAQLKERGDVERTKRFETSGAPGTFQDIKELGQYFEYTDWAYDEDPSGVSLKDNLKSQCFSLLRHDKTTLPGYVGHYVAISKEKKLALIGVKGTSNFEDMMTDCCGLAVTCKLERPFVPGGSTEIRCHEGVLISSRRLADDLQDFVEQLLLPTGYKICIVGHSLGAAGAAMLGVFLKSRIPILGEDVNGTRLRVLAFACPPILNYSNAVDCASFVRTIVNNSDVIPRASLSNLVIALQVLKDVDQKLKEKGLDGSTAISTLEFWKKMASGTKGDLLMNADELAISLNRAVDTVELDDPDHLYVPGSILTMYDKWETLVAPQTAIKEIKSDENENVNEDQEKDQEVEWGFVVSPDGSSDVLRMIEWNPRMVEDHMSPSYRSSIKSILAAAQHKH